MILQNSKYGIFITSKNRGPASLLGSGSGAANALYSAPKHLIDPKFWSKHADVQVYRNTFQTNVEWALRSRREKNEACATAHACRRGVSPRNCPDLLWFACCVREVETHKTRSHRVKFAKLWTRCQSIKKKKLKTTVFTTAAQKSWERRELLGKSGLSKQWTL